MITFHIAQAAHRGRVKPFALTTWEGRQFWAVGAGGVADVAALLRGAGCPDVAWVAVDAAHEVLFKGKETTSRRD